MIKKILWIGVKFESTLIWMAGGIYDSQNFEQV